MLSAVGRVPVMSSAARRMNCSSVQAADGVMFSSRHFLAVNWSATVFGVKAKLTAAPGRGTTAWKTLTRPENRTMTAAWPVVVSVLTRPASLTVATSVSLLSYCARRVTSSTRPSE